MEPVEKAMDRDNFSWIWFFVVHGLALVVMPILGYENSDSFMAAAWIFGFATVGFTIAAAGGRRYGRAVAVFSLGVVLDIVATLIGIYEAFAHHWTIL